MILPKTAAFKDVGTRVTNQITNFALSYVVIDEGTIGRAIGCHRSCRWAWGRALKWVACVGMNACHNYTNSIRFRCLYLFEWAWVVDGPFWTDVCKAKCSAPPRLVDQIKPSRYCIGFRTTLDRSWHTSIIFNSILQYP